jgi:hypothetical protein
MTRGVQTHDGRLHPLSIISILGSGKAIMVFICQVAAPDFYRSAGSIYAVVFNTGLAACAPSSKEMAGTSSLVFSQRLAAIPLLQAAAFLAS